MHSEKRKCLTFVKLNETGVFMAQDIRHEGVVDSIDGQSVIVRITQSSACGGCQVRNICRAAESKEKLIEVSYADADSLKVGQSVTISGSERLGMKAVVIAFGYPLMLLLIVMIVILSVSGSEKAAAIGALAVCVPYYLATYLLRDRIKKDFQFRIIQ